VYQRQEANSKKQPEMPNSRPGTDGAYSSTASVLAHQGVGAGGSVLGEGAVTSRKGGGDSRGKDAGRRTRGVCVQGKGGVGREAEGVDGA
jgi:hypothetical protein